MYFVFSNLLSRLVYFLGYSFINTRRSEGIKSTTMSALRLSFSVHLTLCSFQKHLALFSRVQTNVAGSKVAHLQAARAR